jgi:protein SCO1/2
MAMDALMPDQAQPPRAVTAHNDGYARIQAKYNIPNVTLLDTGGAHVSLRKVMSDDRPVMLNFIFTSCGMICPVMSATFAKVQDMLGPDGANLRMVSISIDPEFDTPQVMKAYAEKYGAGSQWLMLTGSASDSIKVQRAFDVYRGNKMNHAPLTFLRARPGQPWVRLEGFASASDLVNEYRLLAAR